MVAENEVLKEFASRELSRRHLLPFIQRCHPGYMAGWVHHELCERLEVFAADVIANKSPRLMVMMPPRLGKSLIASQYFPAWFLGRFPDKEIISCSYALSLQLSFSKKVRSLLSSEAFSAVFPQAQLSEDMQSAEGWRTTANGGFKPAGRGGPINGFGCLAGSTLIQTATHGLIPVATLVRLWYSTPVEVLGFDHVTGEIKPCRVLAVKTTENQDVIRVRTTAGRAIRLTADHRVYVHGRGYTEAGLLEPGDRITTLQEIPEYPVRGMRSSEEEGRPAVQGLLSGKPAAGGLPGLQKLWGQLLSYCRGGGKGGKTGLSRRLLLIFLQYGASCSEKLANLPRVRGFFTGPSAPLFPGMPEETPRAAEKTGYLRRLWNKIRSGSAPHYPLLKSVRRYNPCESYDWGRELELQTWGELHQVVRGDAASCISEGSSGMRGMQGGCPGAARSSSHRWGPGEQLGGQLGDDVLVVPYNAPQVGSDTISVVESVCDRGIPVYDLQVEGTSNLFANEILVHNCHILVIDDLIKNATEAYSDSTRSSAWEWYTSTARTRLAPGGGILTIGTRWHHDDPMGRMEDGEGDVFDVIRYPAIATHDESHRKRGEALHPERYDVKELRKIQSAVGPAVWEALYQQNPTPDVGGYFEDSWFRYYTGTPEDLRTFMAWDLAIGKKERNDWTVGVIGGVDQVGNLYILDMIRAKLDSLAIVDTIISMHEKYETFLCGIERGQLSMAILPMLNARIADHGAYSLAIKEMAPGRQDKESRARSLQGRLRQGKVFLPQDAEWLADLKGEFLQFPNSRHDDIVDSCAYLVLLMDEIPPVRSVEPTVEPEWLKRILKTFANPTFMGA